MKSPRPSGKNSKPKPKPKPNRSRARAEPSAGRHRESASGTLGKWNGKRPHPSLRRRLPLDQRYWSHRWSRPRALPGAAPARSPSRRRPGVSGSMISGPPRPAASSTHTPNAGPRLQPAGTWPGVLWPDSVRPTAISVVSGPTMDHLAGHPHGPMGSWGASAMREPIVQPSLPGGERSGRWGWISKHPRG